MNGLALCAGVGGLELGLKLALGEQYKCVGYVERDVHAAATLVARMADKALDQAPIWDDITTFNGESWRGIVDIISAGFPCQPFSIAGRRRGIKDKRWLWPEIERITSEIMPEILFIENVPGLVNHGMSIMGTGLLNMGYCLEAGFFSAAEIGSPHKRKRFFLLAHLLANSRCVSTNWKQSRRRGRPCWPYPFYFSGDWPPGLEPAIRRVADGPSDRVDRLRALGNGVVPLVAAHAFRILSFRAGFGQPSRDGVEPCDHSPDNRSALRR